MNHERRLLTLLFTFVLLCQFGLSQQNKIPANTPSDESQQKNLQEYIELLRSNVRQEKAQILGAVMDLNASDAAKFWPIYDEYDSELNKLNKMRGDNILEYARTYNDMTDSKANELITSAMSYQKQRAELLSKYYGRVKDAIGAINAARFVQIEHQLLLIIDLQVASNLPVVGASASTNTAQGGKR